MTLGFTASDLRIQHVTPHPVALPPKPDSMPKVLVVVRRCMLTDDTTCMSTPV
jgi:hypothetical protein